MNFWKGERGAVKMFGKALTRSTGSKIATGTTAWDTWYTWYTRYTWVGHQIWQRLVGAPWASRLENLTGIGTISDG